MHYVLVVAVSIVLAAAWVPVAIFFWRSWKRRRTPLSLAICGVVSYPIYTNVSAAVLMKNEPVWAFTSLAVINAAVLINFYLCYQSQRRTFPEMPSPVPPSTKPPAES